MNLIIIEEKTGKIRVNKFFDWLFYMVGYALILISVSLIFKKTIYIDPAYFGFWGFMAAVIIYILNKTVKPILVWLTLPLTGLTLGLFYPFINVFILNIVDFLLQDHFKIKGLFMSFICAVLISLMNVIYNEIVESYVSKRRDL